MTDPDLIAKKLALIETSVEELRTLARPQEIPHDLREERFAERTLQIAIQAALDAASHVVSDRRLGEPQTNRELFELLERADLIPSGMAKSLGRMAGFRNILVHGYEIVDPLIVKNVIEDHLDDLLAFSEAIRRQLS